MYVLKELSQFFILLYILYLNSSKTRQTYLEIARLRR